MAVAAAAAAAAIDKRLFLSEGPQEGVKHLKLFPSKAPWWSRAFETKNGMVNFGATYPSATSVGVRAPRSAAIIMLTPGAVWTPFAS